MRIRPLLALPLVALTLLATGTAVAAAPAAPASGSSAPTPTTASVAAALPAWQGSAVTISAHLARRMRPSHRAGCPVALSDLRYLQTTYLGFDGVARTGELVVHRYYAAGTLRIFRTMYEARFPVRQMRLVDDYDGSDDRSMAADNTSAYNCRTVSGSTRWSEHAYGRAIDINPIENPYVVGSYVSPPAGKPYAFVSRAPNAKYYRGMIRSNDVVVRAFAAVSWQWGGYWSRTKDYQHFSRTGR